MKMKAAEFGVISEQMFVRVKPDTTFMHVQEMHLLIMNNQL